MFNSDYTDLLKILRIPSHERTEEEHDYIFAFLRSIGELKHYRETLLKSIAWIIRHEQFTVPNTVIYSNGDRITCWYILLSGSIFLGGKMFLPTTCFGRRIGKDTYRREDCIALEACDLLVIDTPDLESRPVVVMNYPHHGGGHHAVVTSAPAPESGLSHHHYHGDRLAPLHSKHHAAAAAAAAASGGAAPAPESALLARLSDPAMAKRMSHSSDTSSAYSGSGELDSSVQNCDSDEELQQLRSLDGELSSAASGVQVTPEPPRRSPLLVALEKEPKERTGEDIELLLEAFQRLHAFSNFTRATQRQFAQCMLYAVVEQPGRIVLDDGEKLDSWSVIVDGEVEIQRPGSPPVRLQCGDAFGVKPTTERQHHVGVMRSLVPNCRFAFITQEKYCRVLSAEAENSIEVRASDGSLQLVKEIRTLESGTLKKQHTVIRGTPEALIDQLLECRSGSSSDPNYADDFLLTYRTFLDNGVPVARRLLEALSNGSAEQASRAVRVFLLWTNNHFEDFDASPELFRLLRQFERQLERREDTPGAQNLLRIACSTKSRVRKAKYEHPQHQQQHHQQVFCLADRLCYVREAAPDGSLRCGDRLLQIDGLPVEHMPVAKLRELLLPPMPPPPPQSSSAARRLLELTVRWDPLGFCKMQQQQQQQQLQVSGGGVVGGGGGGGSLGRAAGSTVSDEVSSTTAAGVVPAASKSASMKSSTSNPDLSAGFGGAASGASAADLPDHVIRVFRPDGGFKLLCINRETSAHEVVMLSMQEFGLQGASSDYKLMEVSVSVGPLVRRRTLSDRLQDLGNRLELNARYYVKHQTELAHQFLSDADAQEVLREAAVDFLQLDPQEVAMRITMEDFGVFQRILPTQLVNWWHKKEKASQEFNELSGVTERESNWPVNELSPEQNNSRRVRLLKHFLKVCQHCRQLNNLNTLMSVTLGLAKSQNSQLNPAWDKLPKKYKDAWKSLEKLTDIRMNHSSYRQMFRSDKFHAPAIPYLPILCKDLTAIRECNERMQDGLVNFEKLRLLAREVRGFCQYAQAGYEGHIWRGSGGGGGGISGRASFSAATASSASGASLPPSALRRAGSSSALMSASGVALGSVGGGLGSVGSAKRRSAAVSAMAKKLHDESVAEKKLTLYVARLRDAAGEDAASSSSATAAAGSLSSSSAISQCPEVGATAGSKFYAADERSFNRLMALSDGKRPARHQHIPAAPAPAARPPLPPPYQQVMQQRLGGSTASVASSVSSVSSGGASSSSSSQQPPPQPPPRSDSTVATTRPAVPPPYHQAVARRESLG